MLDRERGHGGAESFHSLGGAGGDRARIAMDAEAGEPVLDSAECETSALAMGVAILSRVHAFTRGEGDACIARFELGEPYFVYAFGR